MGPLLQDDDFDSAIGEMARGRVLRWRKGLEGREGSQRQTIRVEVHAFGPKASDKLGPSKSKLPTVNPSHGRAIQLLAIRVSLDPNPGRRTRQDPSDLFEEGEQLRLDTGASFAEKARHRETDQEAFFFHPGLEARKRRLPGTESRADCILDLAFQIRWNRSRGYGCSGGDRVQRGLLSGFDLFEFSARQGIERDEDRQTNREKVGIGDEPSSSRSRSGRTSSTTQVGPRKTWSLS